MDAHRECIAVGECRPRHNSRKDTKRWCKGRVGVPHIWLFEESVQTRFGVPLAPTRWRYESVRCFGCGKPERGERVTCHYCGAHARHVYRYVDGCLYGEAWACDCPDNLHPGFGAWRGRTYRPRSEWRPMSVASGWTRRFWR